MSSCSKAVTPGQDDFTRAVAYVDHFGKYDFQFRDSDYSLFIWLNFDFTFSCARSDGY